MGTNEQGIGRISALERVTNSANGNPRWRITLVSAGGGVSSFLTAADHAFNYEIGNTGLRVGDRVQVKANRRGTLTNVSPA